MLQRVEDDKNMHVPAFPSMCLFTTKLEPNPEKPEKVVVSFGLEHTFDKPDQVLPSADRTLEVPLQPDVSQLKKINVVLHTATTSAYVMDDNICKWFSDRFGFQVRLNYIGLNKRQVLGNLNPNAPRSYVGDAKTARETHEAAKQTGLNGGWLDGIKAGVGNMIGTVASYSAIDAFRGVEDGLTFADLAAFLVVNYKSHEDAEGRVQTSIDIEKFRPNIVIEGSEKAWEEDRWAEIAIGTETNESRIAFTSNCARCASINVDYETGRPAEGPTGNLLKSLQSDRRIDPGTKYSPIFGRYGFLSTKNGQRSASPVTISVGDEVRVTKVNEKDTYFCKSDLMLLLIPKTPVHMLATPPPSVLPSDYYPDWPGVGTDKKTTT